MSKYTYFVPYLKGSSIEAVIFECTAENRIEADKQFIAAGHKPQGVRCQPGLLLNDESKDKRLDCCLTDPGIPDFIV